MGSQLALIPITPQEEAEAVILHPHEWANRGAFFAAQASRRSNDAHVNGAFGNFENEKRLRMDAVRNIDSAMSALRRAREGLVT